MKYVSLSMIAIILILSWFLIRPTDDLTAEQHTRLQQVISEYLQTFISETNPKATDIAVPTVTTKVLEAGKKMQAHFKVTYSQAEEGASEPHKISRDGFFTLTSEDGQNWTAKMERIDDSIVEFGDGDGIKISLADAKAAAKEEAEQEAKEKAAKEAPAH